MLQMGHRRQMSVVQSIRKADLGELRLLVLSSPFYPPTRSRRRQYRITRNGASLPTFFYSTAFQHPYHDQRQTGRHPLLPYFVLPADERK